MIPFRNKSQKNLLRRARQLGSKMGRSRRETRLGFESLEQRTMLAVDLTTALASDFAEITGVVRNDLQGDGNSANDVVVAGATVTLYSDNGNGTFDSSDVQLGAAQTTDSAGRYLFDGISAGKYFVKVDPPTGLQFRSGENVQVVNITAAEADGAVGPTIDGFTTEQIVTVSPPLPASDPSTQLDSDVMGGERDMYVELTQGTNPLWRVALVSGGGILQLASDSSVTGTAKIVWDGVDGSQAVNPTGLGGLDFTSYEGNTMTGISLTVGADHQDAVVKLKVYTDAGNWTEYETTVPETAGGAATQHVTFRFADTPASQSGGGADFSNVGALELTFEGVSAVDGQVSLIGLVGVTTKQADFTALPKMSLGDRVWIDHNNDGLLQSGEQGAAGVVINLYEDTDGNNAYTAGVDTLLDITTTDGSGNYLFEDLFPGDYIVQVAEANFASGAALAGLRTSTGNDPAADPDDNVNSDDNGTALAGSGVVSQAVTLIGNSEPTNDGDSNANSNRSVDFGFFGFDLVLDKSVEKTSVAPAETLTYSVLVTNDGPSTAYSVEFTDTLPDMVTFQSGSTTLAGVGVQHSDGIVTADLGTMESGDSVILTIVVTVNANATGTLLNEATVIAPDELDLSNNTDSVINTVTPRIDLAITKTDSRDPVEPGSTFYYTLEVVNNGPSDATGVTITDVLPATGVTYVNASVTPDSISGDTIVFEVGDLAAGASTSVDITVQVDENFSGQLLNHSEVQGDQTETNLNNNEDDEPTLVKVQPASVGGNVYVDKDDDGIFDPEEKPIAGVLLTLTGTDFQGKSVTRTTTTASDGSYLFDNLQPGEYNISETQPPRKRDGKDTVGDNGDGIVASTDGFLAPDLNADDDQDADAIEGITLAGGQDGTEYNFGEQAINTSKIDYISRSNWW